MKIYSLHDISHIISTFTWPFIEIGKNSNVIVFNIMDL